MVKRDKIKGSIDDWMTWYKRSVDHLINRVSLPLAKGALTAKKVAAYTGVRRCGKTSAAILASKNARIDFGRILYFNFEDPITFLEKGPSVLDEIISVYTEYAGTSPEFVLFDEIQNIDGWERWVRKAVDMERFKLHITGSSAKMLSSELSTAISGRNIEIPVWPLSFGEFLEFSKKAPGHRDEYIAAMRTYMSWGGFPEVVLTKNIEDKKHILRQYVNDIVFKDVIGRHEIRSKHQIDQLAVYYFTNISAPHSHNSVSKALQMNHETVADYTEYFSDAFLFFEVKRYHHNLKVQSRDAKKIYCIDTGMRNVYSLSPFNDELGKLAENVVYIDLRRKGKDVWYFKGDGEADFVITRLGKPQGVIQVCYSDLADAGTFKREMDGLTEALKYTGLSSGTILTLSREEKIKHHKNNIELVPLYKWLLRDR
ncbi:MAG: ATP-binding protein [Deltaproteobacteria bacterium]|nr:ATP-binding protein [Deltaproteobacteria bacterium]